jgi:hypothetical protein
MFDPTAFLSDPAIDREQMTRAIDRIRDDALMLDTEHGEKAIAFIEAELVIVRYLLSK